MTQDYQILGAKIRQEGKIAKLTVIEISFS